MNPRAASVGALVLMVAGIVSMFLRRELFAWNVAGITVQAAAVCLMIWARLVFGLRSFHAAANPTSGGLVMTGPYRFIRHPIYAAICYFVWAGAIAHHSLTAIVGAVLVTTGAAIRMVAEERLLVGMYPQYEVYRRRTRRVVPFVF
jgi:protein-S-isoprenylcysteine O-methyltransferase Ste14